MLIFGMLVSLVLAQDDPVCDAPYLKTICAKGFEPIDANVTFPAQCLQIINSNKDSRSKACDEYKTDNDLQKACDVLPKIESEYKMNYVNEDCESKLKQARDEAFAAKCGSDFMGIYCGEEIPSLKFMREFIARSEDKYPCGEDRVASHITDLQLCVDYKADNDVDKACEVLNLLKDEFVKINLKYRDCPTEFEDNLNKEWENRTM